MSGKAPLVYDETTAGQRQLQTQEDLDIPLDQRVLALERKLVELGEILVAQEIEVPPALLRG